MDSFPVWGPARTDEATHASKHWLRRPLYWHHTRARGRSGDPENQQRRSLLCYSRLRQSTEQPFRNTFVLLHSRCRERVESLVKTPRRSGPKAEWTSTIEKAFDCARTVPCRSCSESAPVPDRSSCL